MEETHHQAEDTRLLGPKVLLSGAWRLFRSRIKTLFALMLIPVLSFIAAVGLSILFIALIPGSWAWLTVTLIVVLVLLAIAVMVPIYPALILNLKEESNIGWKRSYRGGFPYFWPFIWVALLTGLAVMGGFALLIIPGIMVSVWLYFASILTVAENARGIDALQKSREYVRGRWWATFWRILVPTLLLMGLQIILSMFPFSQDLSDTLETILSLVSTPFIIAYDYLLYKELHRTYRSSYPTRKHSLIVLIWIGIAAIVALAGFSLWFLSQSSLI